MIQSQLENTDVMKRLLQSMFDVISRRTSPGYAAVIIDSIFKKIVEKHNFLRYVDIKHSQYSEDIDVIEVDDKINSVAPQEMGQAIKDIISIIATALGKDADYYFIRELKESLGYDYESAIKDMGVDLDVMQFQYIVDRKQTKALQIENIDVLARVFKTLFDAMEKEMGRASALPALEGLVERLSTKYELLKYVKVNDIRHIPDVDLVSIAQEINSADPQRVGELIEKLIIEISGLLGKEVFLFVDEFKNHLTEEYLLKIEEMGVNLNVLKLRYDIVIKHVIKALIDVLGEASTKSYAVLVIDTVLKNINKRYGFLRYIEIDSSRYSDGLDAINITSSLDDISMVDIGRALQKLIEGVVKSLGEDAGRYFIDKFKDHLGKTFLLKIEEMGVNLHMIQLRQNLLW
ncbi:MAG: hypothetical protein DRN05_05775 [Thermoplasmata archaeon]|nr:MAG: hypothetical protein DRN05_05775 [Thermoplasmata archaeon]